MDYTECLRRLSVHDAELADALVGERDGASAVLDPKILELVRLAALISVGGSLPSYGAQSDAAIDAGATPAEIVDVLIGLIPVIGLPRAVAAAPTLSLALGYDTEAALGE